MQILQQKNKTSSPTLTGCLAKTSQDQHLKLTPQIRILFYKVFPDKIRSKQISVAETLFKSPQASIFFSHSPFSKCRIECSPLQAEWRVGGGLKLYML